MSARKAHGWELGIVWAGIVVACSATWGLIAWACGSIGGAW